MKKILSVIMVLTVCYLLLGNGLSFAQEDSVVIGLNVPISGSYQEQGEDEVRAYKLAIDEINAQGGILGKKVVCVVKNSQTSGSVAAENARVLYTKENAVMVTGGAVNAEAVAQAKVAGELGKLFIACFVQSDAITGFEENPKTGENSQVVNRYTFRWYNNVWMSAHAAAKILLERFGSNTKYYYITADYSWGWSAEKAFRKVLEKSRCKTVGAVRTPLGEKSYVQYLLKAKMAKPDVLVLVQAGKDLVNSIKQAQAMGLSKELKIVVPLIELYTAKSVGADYLQGVIGTSSWQWELMDKYTGSKNFVEKFKAKYDRYPGCAAAAAWVAVCQYADAVKKAGTFEPKAVVKAMEGNKFTLLKGEEYWREWDHQAITSSLIFECKAPENMKNEWDFFNIIGEVPGEKIARTKEDNPV